MRPGPIRPGDDNTARLFNKSKVSFNEARADSPGRLVGRRDWPDPVGRASMRPGPIRPGDTSGQVYVGDEGDRLQ